MTKTKTDLSPEALEFPSPLKPLDDLTRAEWRKMILDVARKDLRTIGIEGKKLKEVLGTFGDKIDRVRPLLDALPDRLRAWNLTNACLLAWESKSFPLHYEAMREKRRAYYKRALAELEKRTEQAETLAPYLPSKMGEELREWAAGHRSILETFRLPEGVPHSPVGTLVRAVLAIPELEPSQRVEMIERLALVLLEQTPQRKQSNALIRRIRHRAKSS